MPDLHLFQPVETVGRERDLRCLYGLTGNKILVVPVVLMEIGDAVMLREVEDSED